MKNAACVLRPRRGLEGIAGLVGERAWINVVSLRRRAQPPVDSTMVTGSLASRSVASMACAASRSTRRVRRSSPYSAASAQSRCASAWSASPCSPQRLELGALDAQLLLLVADLQLLELRQMTELGFEDSPRLFGAEF